MKDDLDIENYKIAALLHDTIEDTDATYEEILELFGKEIADIVQNVTSNKQKSNELGKTVYLSYKMVEINDKDLTLKLCDRFDNICGIEHVNDEFNEI